MTVHIDPVRAADAGRKTVTTGLALEPALLKMAKTAARRQGMSTSSFIRGAIREHLRDLGYDPPPPFEFQEEA